MLRRRNIRCVLTTPTTCSPPPNDAGTALSNAPSAPCENPKTNRTELHGHRHRRRGPPCVSRAWLYAQTGLRDQIRQLTHQRPTSPPVIDQTQRSSDASLRQRLTLAHTRIRELDDENRRLQNQVAELHGQLRGTRLRGTPVADTVHDENNLVRLPNDRTGPR